MTEFAFDCVRQHCEAGAEWYAKGPWRNQVVGVYASNACNSQDKVSSVATHVLSKIEFEQKIGVQILGRKMNEIGRDSSKPPIRLFASVDPVRFVIGPRLEISSWITFYKQMRKDVWVVSIHVWISMIISMILKMLIGEICT